MSLHKQLFVGHSDTELVAPLQTQEHVPPQYHANADTPHILMFPKQTARIDLHMILNGRAELYYTVCRSWLGGGPACETIDQAPLRPGPP